MQITRQIVADQLSAYLHRQVSLAELVDWSERQIMDGEFESTAVRDAVARLGVADVRAFGLTWDDCQRLLHELGFEARVHIETA
jgi:cobyrinic acid a,c-diamide synthase